MRLTDYELVTKEIPVGGSPVFDDLSPHRSPYRRTGATGGFRRVPKAVVSRSPLPRTPRRTSPAQRRLEYGRASPGSGRSLRERESGWAI